MYGKGDWRSISRNVVKTKTATQVASHAQKYFHRLHSEKKKRQRPSIHDTTTAYASRTSSMDPVNSLVQIPRKGCSSEGENMNTNVNPDQVEKGSSSGPDGITYKNDGPMSLPPRVSNQGASVVFNAAMHDCGYARNNSRSHLSSLPTEFANHVGSLGNHGAKQFPGQECSIGCNGPTLMNNQVISLTNQFSKHGPTIGNGSSSYAEKCSIAPLGHQFPQQSSLSGFNTTNNITHPIPAVPHFEVMNSHPGPLPVGFPETIGRPSSQFPGRGGSMGHNVVADTNGHPMSVTNHFPNGDVFKGNNDTTNANNRRVRPRAHLHSELNNANTNGGCHSISPSGKSPNEGSSGGC